MSTLRARLEREEAELGLLQNHLDYSEQALHDAEARFRDVEELYMQHQRLRDDAASYFASSRQKRDEQRKTVAA